MSLDSKPWSLPNCLTLASLPKSAMLLFTTSICSVNRVHSALVAGVGFSRKKQPQVKRVPRTLVATTSACVLFDWLRIVGKGLASHTKSTSNSCKRTLDCSKCWMSCVLCTISRMYTAVPIDAAPLYRVSFMDATCTAGHCLWRRWPVLTSVAKKRTCWWTSSMTAVLHNQLKTKSM